MSWFQFGAGSLISVENMWAQWAVILAGVALSIYLEQTYRWAAKLSGPVLALLLAMLLSNLAIMPMESPTYDVISSYLVPTAVSLLLFRASIVEILRTSRSAFVCMQVAIVGSALGGIIAGLLLNARILDLPELTGMMTASYTGGGVNFYAVKDIYSVDEELTSSLLVADNFVMAAAFLLLFSLAVRPLMRAWYPHPHSAVGTDADATQQAKLHWQPKGIALLDIGKALAIAVSIAAVANFIATNVTTRLMEQAADADSQRGTILWQIATSLAGSKYVWVTLLTIVAATLLRKYLSSVAGTDELGGYLLYVFLFSIGLPSDLMKVVQNVPMMFALCAVIAVVNIVFTLIVGKLLRLNLEELLLACNASLGGPPTAAAMAISMGWTRLVTPGVLIGLWGYVTGTAVGVAVAEVLRQYVSIAAG